MTITPNTEFNHLLGQTVNVFLDGRRAAVGTLFFVGVNAVGHRVVSLRGGVHMTVPGTLTLTLHQPEPTIGLAGDRSWLNTLD